MIPMPALPQTLIKHKGYVQFPKLLKTISGWFSREGYKSHETKHKYKGGGEAEYEVDFKGEKKINEYVRYKIDVSIRAWEVKQVELTQEGQKIKTQYGRIHVAVSPSYDLDWQGRFGGNKFLQELQNFFHKYIIYRDINDKWVDDLLFKSIHLARNIKEEFGHEG